MAKEKYEEYIEREFVPFENADRAVHFIKTRAEEYGILVGRCKGLEHLRKVTRSEQELASTKPTVAERQAEAESSNEYKKIIEDYENAWAEKTTLKTQIKAAEMTFDLYRSSNKWQMP